MCKTELFSSGDLFRMHAVVRPIFAETGAADGEMPSATAEELALLF